MGELWRALGRSGGALGELWEGLVELGESFGRFWRSFGRAQGISLYHKIPDQPHLAADVNRNFKGIW